MTLPLWFLIGMMVITIVGDIAEVVDQHSQADDQFHRNMALQEQSQQFSHDERIEQNEYEQQMHEFNIFNDPILKTEGLVASGMSKAGALQAISGASTGFAPTASNSTAGTNSVGLPQTSFLSDLGNVIPQFGQLMQSLGNANKANSDVKVNEQEIRYSQQMIDESNSRMAKLANDMQIDNAQLELAKAINASQIGLNQSQIDLNYQKINEIGSNIQKNFAQIKNLDAATASEYVKASLYLSEINVNNASEAKLYAESDVLGYEAEKIQSQTQNIQFNTLNEALVAELKSMRLELSKALGCDVDAPLTTQIMEAMAVGQYDTVARLLECRSWMENGVIGNTNRAAASIKYDYKPYPARSTSFFRSQSFRSDWNPIWMDSKYKQFLKF